MSKQIDLRLVLRGQREVAEGLQDTEAALKDVGDAAEKSGKQAERGSSGLGKVGGVLGGWAKKGVLAGTAAGVALVGTSLVKGFQRLNGIDQAKAKLTGLGHSAASVQAIMDNSLAAVQGTAFGLDEAAGTAAGAVAAGVKPGKELERTLTLVADAATIGGTSMGEMGAIFNKVATSNKVQGEVIAQLGDRGIPIVQLLAEQLGVTGEEVMELSRKGQIGFGDFQAAMEAGMGGAAQASGKTFQGSLKNAGAALGRLGAAVLAPAFDRLPGLLQDASARLDDLGPVAERVGSWIGDNLMPMLVEFGTFAVEAIGRLLPVLGEVGSFIAGIVIPAVSSLFDFLNRYQDVLVPLAAGVLAMVAAYRAYVIITGILKAATIAFTAVQAALNLVMSANPVGIVVLALIGLGAALVTAYNKSETFRGIVDTMFGALKSFGTWLGDTLMGLFNSIGSALLQMGIYGVRAFRFVVTAAFNAFEGILNAADKGLSWIPGLGDKISGARTAFSNFSDKTVGKLQKVENQLRAAKNEADGLAKDRSATITITRREINEIITRRITEGTKDLFRADGGPVTAGQPYIVGEKRPELFVPKVDGMILPRVPESLNLSDADVTVGPMGPGQPIVVRVELDGRVVAESVVDAVEGERARA